MGEQGSWLHRTHAGRHLRDCMKNSSSQHSEKAVWSAVNSLPFSSAAQTAVDSGRSGDSGMWSVASETPGLYHHHFQKSEAGSERFLWVLESVLLVFSLRIAQNFKSQVQVKVEPKSFLLLISIYKDEFKI